MVFAPDFRANIIIYLCGNDEANRLQYVLPYNNNIHIVLRWVKCIFSILLPRLFLLLVSIHGHCHMNHCIWIGIFIKWICASKWCSLAARRHVEYFKSLGFFVSDTMSRHSGWSLAWRKLWFLCEGNYSTSPPPPSQFMILRMVIIESLSMNKQWFC